uniref:Programmed cell death protein 5 n=1 Tax=Romanomermis culicivorax TaxID=13658 RepID=A0A915K064_ROMCU
MIADVGVNFFENAIAQQEQQKKEAEAREQVRNTILSQVLDQNARARLSNISIAKPEKAQMLENMIINSARMGRIAGKLTDEQFKKMLDQVNDQVPTKKTTVTFDRRRAALDSDDEY